MFLRSLTLKGFKSFAEPTTLELEPGVTVVVGPNGSGKSNLVDAVAWVLGAQGPRTVRSARMDDVIFAGNGRRPPLGRAEVGLVIDNSSGLLPIEFSEVTVTRTLFRSSGESEYAINGVPCRLLDVQELLSDTGVGRQQHVIVSQGQLDAVLDARPEDRRLIVEEAAGILKFRRRKEKAERRLQATEADLLRLGDLLREVRRQLRPLERQAEATRCHDQLATELRAVRVHLLGRQVAALRARAAVAARSQSALGTEEGRLRRDLDGLDGSISGAEAWLAAAGRARLDETLGRLEAVRERARGLAAVLAERGRSVQRDRDAAVDQALVASLEADAHRLVAELAELDEAAAGAEPGRRRLARAQEELAQEWAAFDAPPEGPGPPAADRAAEVRGELAAVRVAVERDRAEHVRLRNRLASLEARAEALAAESAAGRSELAETTRHRDGLAKIHEEAEERSSRSSAAATEAEAAKRGAERERAVWAARAEALALALDHSRDDAPRLDDVDGALGALADLVVVDPGWEAAFEAAAGESLAAVVVDGVDAARRALVARSGTDGALALLPLGAPAAPRETSPPATGPGSASNPGPAAGELVRAHVRSSHPGVERLLDAVLGAALAVEGGWAEAVDTSLNHPGSVVVTRGGDRFSRRGWRVGGRGAAATEAALAEASRQAEAAAALVTDASAALDSARVAALVDAERSRQAARALADGDQALAALESVVRRRDAEEREVAAAARTAQAALLHQETRLAQAEARVGELEAALPALEAQEAAGAEMAAAVGAARQRLQERADALAALATELEIRRAGIAQRRSYLGTRLAELEARMERCGAERQAAATRRAALDLVVLRTGRLASAVAGRLAQIDTHLADVRARRGRQAEQVAATSERLAGLRGQRVEAERRLEEVRELSRRAEIEGAEAAMRLEAAVEAMRRELDVTPEVAERAPCPELPAGTSAESRARELERELRLLGPVNPLATEELAALQERHTFLEAQLDDVKSSRRDLGRVIRAVDAEIVQLLSAAYADVADNFVRLFDTLFPGGQGRLGLTNADDLLQSGIEIEARPAGKNVRRLSLLSGGERSLCALAFLFAVFRSRPSPFYLLDEVEAALDDVNLHRFLDLLAEFRQEAQLLVVSHQKRTMEAADCLYGVTMQGGGSSRVVSERVRAASGA